MTNDTDVSSVAVEGAIKALTDLRKELVDLKFSVPQAAALGIQLALDKITERVELLEQ